MEYIVFLEKSQFLILSRNPLPPHTFMEPECSSLYVYSQQPTTSFCLEAHESNPRHPISLFMNLFSVILPAIPRLPCGLFASDFSTKTLYEFLLSSMRATCPAQLIFHDLITRIIFGVHETISAGVSLTRIQLLGCIELFGP
jgi:hypothetical protein